MLSEADFNDVGVFDFPVLQPNVADVQTLREEQQHKGTHSDRVVRVCGYSALFGRLANEMQEEIIRRPAG